MASLAESQVFQHVIINNHEPRIGIVCEPIFVLALALALALAVLLLGFAHEHYIFCKCPSNHL